ncbi:hypothetical protein WJX73_007471 [Symbiochloris irregularis]|uniref:Uncharacterized protein n=1 Tax=Symbiochloris irregularis TaxID=706552 RepID=A0AAW1NZG6_9CHLO
MHYAAKTRGKQQQKATNQCIQLNQQIQTLRTAVEVQKQLTGKDPLEQKLMQGVAETKVQGQSAAAVTPGVSLPSTTPAAKSSRLTPQAEATLMSFFSLQDMLSKEEAVVLAELANCEEVQLAAKVGAADGAREASMERLAGLTDEKGGIASPQCTGPLLTLMRSERSFEVRVAILDAVMHTGPVILTALAHGGGFCVAMESWLSHGNDERQTSFLRMLLKMLANVPLPKAVLSSSRIPKLITALQKYRGSTIAANATALLQQLYWACLSARLADFKASEQAAVCR